MKPCSRAILKRCRQLLLDDAFQAFLDESDTDDDSDGRGYSSPEDRPCTNFAVETSQAGRLFIEPQAPGATNSFPATFLCNIADEGDLDSCPSREISTHDINGKCLVRERLGAKQQVVITGVSSGSQTLQQKDVGDGCKVQDYGSSEQKQKRRGYEEGARYPLEHHDEFVDTEFVNISVFTLGGSVADRLHLPLSTTVREIKLHLWASKGLLMGSQTLMLDTEVLKDDQTLCQHGMVGNVALQLACAAVNEERDCIKAAIRLGGKYKLNNETLVSTNSALNEVTIRNPRDGTNSKSFRFDAVFNEACLQQHVFESIGRDVVEEFISGFSCTVFAYGTSTSCKSQTLFGTDLSCPQEEIGLVARSLKFLFMRLGRMPVMKDTISCGLLAIRKNNVYDLLSDHPCQSRVELKDNLQDVERILLDGLSKGCDSRDVSTGDRTHTIFTLTLETVCQSNQICTRALKMVELAGCERRLLSVRQHPLKDIARIDLSLSALGNVISALTDSKSSFIPYRDSKLTLLLQDSLGGSTKTVFIGHIDPNDFDDSLSTLRYMARARSVKNCPKIVLNSED